jgi:hypothetical protein
MPKNNSSKKSVLQNLSTLDIYDKFKMVALLRKMKINEALEEAVGEWVDKNTMDSSE